MENVKSEQEQTAEAKKRNPQIDRHIRQEGVGQDGELNQEQRAVNSKLFDEIADRIKDEFNVNDTQNNCIVCIGSSESENSEPSNTMLFVVKGNVTGLLNVLIESCETSNEFNKSVQLAASLMSMPPHAREVGKKAIRLLSKALSETKSDEKKSENPDQK